MAHNPMAHNEKSLAARASRSCDRCKARKVRCIVPPTSTTCEGCAKRNKSCHFGHTKRLLRRSNPSAYEPQQPSSIRDSQDDLRPSLQLYPDLYIDRVLTDPQSTGLTNSSTSVFRAHENHITSTNLAFFSESKIRLISERLGHTKLQDLLEDNEADLADKMHKTRTPIKFILPLQPVLVDSQACSTYISAYFEHVHPIYPFLDQKEFKDGIHNFNKARDISANPSLSALYYAVLALGCQQVGRGSFHPGQGQAWEFYQVSLGLLSDILHPCDSLINLQAITAMAIFALNMSCLQIMETLITESARMAHCLGYHLAPVNGKETSCCRTFWVVYCLERLSCLLCSRGPLLADHDIGCPVPDTPEATFAGYNFFHGRIVLSRLISKAHHSLFSISAIMRTSDQYDLAIKLLCDDLEAWKATLPPRLRPGQPYHPMHYKDQPILGVMVLRLHYAYYALLISLCRLRLHVSKDSLSLGKAKEKLLGASRLVIQSTRYIDRQPYTPLWMLSVVPISAMFVIFDFIVFNPLHPETEFNLALMDVAAAYFLRLESATEASLSSSKLTGFAHIASDFIQNSLYGQPPSRSEPQSDFLTMPREQVPVPVGLNGNCRNFHNTPEIYALDEMMSTDEDLSPSSLFYPVIRAQPSADDNLPFGFDFSDLFDIMIPQISS